MSEQQIRRAAADRKIRFRDWRDGRERLAIYWAPGQKPPKRIKMIAGAAQVGFARIDEQHGFLVKAGQWIVYRDGWPFYLTGTRSLIVRSEMLASRDIVFREGIWQRNPDEYQREQAEYE